MKHAPKAIMMIALALSLGLHWVVLQSVAWAGMFVDYSADNSLVVAIDKTFDADNKCDLCLLVENGAKADAEKDSGYTVKLTKIDGFSVSGGVVLAEPALLEFPLTDCFHGIRRHVRPAVPPPLAA